MKKPPLLPRLVFLLPGGLALLAGLDAALLLLGLPAPVTTERLPELHGVLLVFAFVGTVIALERSVALRRWWGFAAPALLGLGGLLALSPAPLLVARIAFTAGSAALVAVYIPLWRRNRDVSVLVQILGAVVLTGGAVLWLPGLGIDVLLPWLAGFVVLTIAGERLELSRVGMLGATDVRADNQILTLAMATVMAVTATLLWPPVGAALLGLALLALVAWLARHDVVRRTVNSTGLPRYMAVCLIAAYVWLAVAGSVWLLLGPVSGGRPYDAVVHAVFLGFTMSMIMAHAPVILPAVVRRPLPYHPVMYASVGLLHASLVVRLLAGDAWGVEAAHRAGGVLNIVALLGFLVTVLWSAARARRSDEPGSPATAHSGPLVGASR